MNHVGFLLKRWCNSFIWCFFLFKFSYFMLQMSRLINTIKWWHQPTVFRIKFTLNGWKKIERIYDFECCFLLSTKLSHSTKAGKNKELWPISIFLLQIFVKCFYFMDYDYHNISFYVMCCNEMQITWLEKTRIEAYAHMGSDIGTISRQRNLMMITLLRISLCILMLRPLHQVECSHWHHSASDALYYELRVECGTW